MFITETFFENLKPHYCDTRVVLCLSDMFEALEDMSPKRST